MNIVNSFKKPTMILTILLAISCSINPLHQGAPKHLDYYLPPPESRPAVSIQDTPKVIIAVPEPTPAQLKMRKDIAKAFTSIEDISKATGDISMSQKELVKINKTLVGGIIKLQSNYDSLRTDNRAVKGSLVSTQAGNRIMAEKISDLLRKTEEERRIAEGFRKMISTALNGIYPFCLGLLVILIGFLLLKWKEVRLQRFINYEG